MLQRERPSRQAQIEDRYVEGRRYRTACWKAERSCRPPLLFFSGIGANIELLAPFLERLEGRNVVTFDMPGIGGSEEFGFPYRLSAMAHVAHRILSDLGHDEIDVMGVSWGGMLAQEFAYRHPRSVNRLVLIATSPGMPMIPGSPSTLLKMLSPRRYSDAHSMKPYLETLYGGAGDGLDSFAARMKTPSSTGYLHQVLAILGWTSARKLAVIPAKTLILMGGEDRLVPPANGHILRFLLERGRLEIIDGAGHLMVLTHMDRALASIEAFLDEAEGTLPARPRRLRALAS